MLELSKYYQSRLYIEYLIYTHIIVLGIKSCQFFRNCMCDSIHNMSFCLGLKVINEVHKHKVYMTYDITVFFYGWMYDVVYNVKLPYPEFFHILEIFYALKFFHFLENFLIVSYFWTLSKLQYTSLINISRRRKKSIKYLIYVPMNFINIC